MDIKKMLIDIEQVFFEEVMDIVTDMLSGIFKNK